MIQTQTRACKCPLKDLPCLTRRDVVYNIVYEKPKSLNQEVILGNYKVGNLCFTFLRITRQAFAVKRKKNQDKTEKKISHWDICVNFASVCIKSAKKDVLPKKILIALCNDQSYMEEKYFFMSTFFMPLSITCKLHCLTAEFI